VPTEQLVQLVLDEELYFPTEQCEQLVVEEDVA